MKAREKLKKTAEKSHPVFKAQTMFPFDFFPDQVEVDRHRLIIIKNWLFGREKVISTQIDEIANAELHTSLFLGEVEVASQFVPAGTHTIAKLKKDDAVALHRILQGFIMAKKRNINLDEIENGELRALLLKLGAE